MPYIPIPAIQKLQGPLSHMAEITYIDPQTDEVHRTVVNLNHLISITAFTRVRDGVQITLPHLTFSNQQFVTGYLLNEVWEDFVAGYFP